MRHVGQTDIDLIDMTYKQKVNLLLSDTGVGSYIPDTKETL